MAENTESCEDRLRIPRPRHLHLSRFCLSNSLEIHAKTSKLRLPNDFSPSCKNNLHRLRKDPPQFRPLPVPNPALGQLRRECFFHRAEPPSAMAVHQSTTHRHTIPSPYWLLSYVRWQLQIFFAASTSYHLHQMSFLHPPRALSAQPGTLHPHPVYPPILGRSSGPNLNLHTLQSYPYFSLPRRSLFAPRRLAFRSFLPFHCPAPAHGVNPAHRKDRLN